MPHSIALDSQGNVYVADRGNARIQIFDETGQFIREWKDASLGRPWAVRYDASGNVFVVDGGDQNEFWPDRARILKLDTKGNPITSFGSYGKAPGQFIWPHAIAIGSDGAVYVAEVGDRDADSEICEAKRMKIIHPFGRVREQAAHDFV